MPDQPRGTPESGPEIVIGLVDAVGVDMQQVCTVLRNSLAGVDYTCGEEVIRLSGLLHEIPAEPWKSLPRAGASEHDRYDQHMTAGNKFRQEMQRGDALAMLAVGAVRDERPAPVAGQAPRPNSLRTYLLRSLKHPKEVEILRRIHGSSFFLVGAYSPTNSRLRELAQRIATSKHSNRADDYLEEAQKLRKRDEKEADELGSKRP